MSAPIKVEIFINGPRCSGKTSILLKLKELLEKEGFETSAVPNPNWSGTAEWMHGQKPPAGAAGPQNPNA